MKYKHASHLTAYLQALLRDSVCGNIIGSSHYRGVANVTLLIMIGNELLTDNMSNVT